MGVGTNRMNRFIIRKASQGLANYLLKIKKDNKVAIGYDSRNNSEDFARETASVLAANGIKAYIYKELMPTPTVSYAIRYLGCDAGVMVTASHNPKQYNGYKVYGNDGCQCTLDMANSIYEEIEKIDVFDGVKVDCFKKLQKEGKIEIISDEVFESFINSTLKQSIFKEEKVLNIAYTPLNGAGRKCILEALTRDGFKDIKVVKEQEQPDGNFTTCPYPNPEIPEALKLGIKLLEKENADILMASDPDSDRIGCVVNNHGKHVILTGNEVGLLLFDMVYQVKKNDFRDKRPVLVKTIVTSDMANIMAKKYNVEVREVLTGFKFIGEQIGLLEKDNETNRYLFGFEESCGYLTNTDVRDKDAVNAALLLAETANHYKLQGKTLCDRINELYDEFGHFKTATMAFEYQGIEGKEKIAKIMKAFRSKEVQERIKGIESYGDYLVGKIYEKDAIKPTNLPSSDVIKFFIKGGETITLRPSGTEPKLKAYVFANGEERLTELTKLIETLIDEQ